MKYWPYFLLTALLGAGCSGDSVEVVSDASIQVESTGGDLTITQLALPEEPIQAQPLLEPLTLTMAADNFSFAPNTLAAQAGQPVNLTFANDGVHTFAIDEIGLEETISQGGVVSFTAPTTPGNYRFYCSVGSHAALGMEGILTVE